MKLRQRHIPLKEHKGPPEGGLLCFCPLLGGRYHSCGAQNILRHYASNILTAAPKIARFIVHRTRFAIFVPRGTFKRADNIRPYRFRGNPKTGAHMGAPLRCCNKNRCVTVGNGLDRSEKRIALRIYGNPSSVTCGDSQVTLLSSSTTFPLIGESSLHRGAFYVPRETFKRADNIRPYGGFDKYI